MTRKSRQKSSRHQTCRLENTLRSTVVVHPRLANGAAGALASGAMASALIAGTVDAALLDGTESEVAQSLGGRRNGKKKIKANIHDLDR